MGDLTKRLSRHEFACKCKCGFDTVDFELPYVLEEVADHFEDVTPKSTRIRIHINSGARCQNHNQQIGGSKNSLHTQGRAADFWMEAEFYDGRREKIHDDLIADHLEGMYPAEYGIGRYNGWTHVDTRSNGPARWDKR
jgi:hypothetical protein